MTLCAHVPHPWGEVLEFRANTCTAGQPKGVVQKSRLGGDVNWWPLRSAVPWPPPCTEIPLKWKKVSKCKFPGFFSTEQHSQTVYSAFIFGLYLSLYFHNLHVEREISI